MGEINKQALLAQILVQLDDERDLLYRAARAAHFEATDEQSKAENKYDTRGLEASYLARGQAKKVKEVESAIEQFRALDSAMPPSAPSIQMGSLVGLKNRKGTSWYFMGPRAGGMEIIQGVHEILVITPHSPLGSQMMGHQVGGKLRLDLAGSRQEFEVAEVR